MKNKKINRRLILCSISTLFAAIVVITALWVFEENTTLYMTPSEVLTKDTKGKIIRVGGLVESGSLHFLDDNQTLEFTITDMNNILIVRYTGIIPNLFAEDRGTVAKGTIQSDGIFIATELLAKHDENYMPPEVAKSLNIIKH